MQKVRFWDPEHWRFRAEETRTVADVSMSKFLLTVCAFGLLLSSAFAEEKSPEQYREKSRKRASGC
jgi:hypothetical protein